MEITRPDQMWAMDITSIPMARGFVYLAVVLDWFSRRVLSWRASITMEAAFCVETLQDDLARHGKPDVFNTDLQPAATPLGSLTLAEAPLIDAENLFRQPGPPLAGERRGWEAT